MKVGFFAWEEVLARIFDLGQLERRGWTLVNRCYLCKGEEESAGRILPHGCNKKALVALRVLPSSVRETLLS